MNLRSGALIAAIFLAGHYSVTGQSPGNSRSAASDRERQIEAEKERVLRREQEIQSFLLGARSLPVELSADLLFETLRASIVTDAKRKRDLVEDLFYRASEARELYRKTYREGVVDTREGYQSMAFDLELDQLSVRLRAVRLMLALDKTRARELFREIPAPKPDLTSCEGSLDYNFAEFYAVLKSITDQTFDAEARKRMQHILFASSYLDEMASPAQVGPAMAFVSGMDGTQAEVRMLLDSLATGLKRVPQDPRSFAFAVKTGRLTSELRLGLIPQVERRGISTDELVRTYRTFLAKNLSGTQCRDTVMMGTEEKPHPVVEAANMLFKLPLGPDDVKPEKILPGAKAFHYWRSPKAAKLLADVKRLRFGGGQAALTVADRSKPEWQQALMKFLDDLDSWQPEDEETENDYLHQRGVLYYSLLDLAPAGEMRGKVLRDYAMFLRDSKMWKDSPAQWLVYAKHILKMGKSLNGPELDAFRETLTGAGNHVFPLYFELDRLRQPIKPAK